MTSDYKCYQILTYEAYCTSFTTYHPVFLVGAIPCDVRYSYLSTLLVIVCLFTLDGRKDNKRISFILILSGTKHIILHTHQLNPQHLRSQEQITCTRWNRTTGPLSPYRFEACTHHQAGSCTHPFWAGRGEFREETNR